MVRAVSRVRSSSQRTVWEASARLWVVPLPNRLRRIVTVSACNSIRICSNLGYTSGRPIVLVLTQRVRERERALSEALLGARLIVC